MRTGKRKRWFISMLLCLGMVLGMIPQAAFAEETKVIKEITVNCSVPSEGHRLDTIEVTVDKASAINGLTASDFTIAGKAYGWSSSKADGFKTADTHDFKAVISAVKAEGEKLTLSVSDFTEKYFYVDSFQVTCKKNPSLSFTKADVTKEYTAVADEFEQITVPEKGKPDLVYNLFTPSDTSVKQPLIVALHGSGDQMNIYANRVVVAWAEPEAQAKHPAYVMAPVFGDQDPEVLVSTLDQVAAEVKKMVADGIVDPDRIYVTGKSMGGGNTVRIAATYPDLFAAALPLCPSAARFEGIDLTALKDMPVWVVQATNDKSVPIEGTRQLVDTVKAAGSYKIKFMEYSFEQMKARGILDNKHHDVEIISLEDGRYADWLFAQSKSDVNGLIDYIRVNTAVPAKGHAIDTIEVYVNNPLPLAVLDASKFTLTGESYKWGSNAENGYRTDETHAFEAKISGLTVDGNKLTLQVSDFPEKYFYVDSFAVKYEGRDDISFTMADVRDTTTAVADTFAQYSSLHTADFDYNLYAPATNGKPQPLVLALHGSGDQMNLLANKVVSAWADPKNQAERPAFVLAPVYTDQSDEAQAATNAKAVEKIQSMIALGLVDPDRVYVTGKSMGGMNTDRVYMNYTDMFAAAMPLCGGYPDDTRDLVYNIADKPIYILQGDGDPAGSGKLLPGSRELYSTLKRLGSDNVFYHEFPKAQMDAAGIGYHDIEILAMEDTSYMEWMFSQNKAAQK